MDVSFFRSRISGPELLLEDSVIKKINKITPTTNLPSWIGYSPRVGAGMPDILFANYEPKIIALSNQEICQTQILALIRALNSAKFEKIFFHLNFSEKNLKYLLNELLDIKILECWNDQFYLSSDWKNIIPMIISIEVKVFDWKRAISQAKRNLLFSNKSYVALPIKTAHRIKNNQIFINKEIGLLSVDGDVVIEEVSPNQSLPFIWEYYYKLALILAKCKKEPISCHL
jgi:hypothetical protein